MAVYSARYARAFLQVVSAVNLDPATVQQQLSDFSETFGGSRELREVFMNPSIAQEQKLRILDAISVRLGMFRQVRNFVAVIMEHQRLGDLHEIFADYATAADVQSGMVEAEITSAFVLNEDDREELEARVETMAGGKIRATYQQDPGLLGGAVVRLGSTVYDGSLKAQLAELRNRLAGTAAV